MIVNPTQWGRMSHAFPDLGERCVPQLDGWVAVFPVIFASCPVAAGTFTFILKFYKEFLSIL